jgi:2'-5' RNA ligase
MSAWDEWLKENEYRYNMSYSISVPKKSGLKSLFNTAEEIYTETGISPDERISLQEDIKTHVTIIYDRKDAKRVLNGDLKEVEYLNMHVIYITKRGDEDLIRGEAGFPEHPGELISDSV